MNMISRFGVGLVIMSLVFCVLARTMVSAIPPEGSLAKHSGDTVDIVIFSYDRALQLYALLESMEKYVRGLRNTMVIYRTSTPAHGNSYEVVKKRFASVTYWHQDMSGVNDFKPLVMRGVNYSNAPYITFAVDDDIIKEETDLGLCIGYLEQTGAHGFYLRMGLHITRCYSMQCSNKARSYRKVAPGVISWSFAQGNGDWGYPGSVEFSIWRKNDITNLLNAHEFSNPSKLEDVINYYTSKHTNALCFERSRVVNLPLNIVNETQQSNKQMNWMTPQQLLEKFEEGYKIDIAPLYKVRNRSCHMEYKPTFVLREEAA